MRKLLIVPSAVPLLANAATPAKYKGGTALSLPNGASGTLETANDASISFSTANAKLVIPYKAIDAFEYSEPVARHLGVVPAIAVGLRRHRQHLHLFRITYHDAAVAHIAIFEVPKAAAYTLNEVLKNRSAKPATATSNSNCECPDQASPPKSRANLEPTNFRRTTCIPVNCFESRQ